MDGDVHARRHHWVTDWKPVPLTPGSSDPATLVLFITPDSASAEVNGVRAAVDRRQASPASASPLIAPITSFGVFGTTYWGVPELFTVDNLAIDTGQERSHRLREESTRC